MQPLSAIRSGSPKPRFGGTVTLKESPRNGRGLMNFGLTLMAKGDYAGALDYFRRALVLTPQYPFLFINFAIAENAIGQTAQAEAHFQEAVRLAPGLPDAYTFYGRFLLAQESRSRSRVAFAKSRRVKSHGRDCAGVAGRDDHAFSRGLPEFEFAAFPGRALYRCHRGQSQGARSASELRRSLEQSRRRLQCHGASLKKERQPVEKRWNWKPDFVLARNNLQQAQERLKALSAKH